MESGWFVALVFSALALLAAAFFLQVSRRGRQPVPQPTPATQHSASLPRK